MKANKVLSMAIGGAFHAGVEVPTMGGWLKVMDDDFELLAHVPTCTTRFLFKKKCRGKHKLRKKTSKFLKSQSPVFARKRLTPWKFMTFVPG